MSPPTPVRAAVLARARFRCERCGESLIGPLGYSLQHRRARGMGGSKRPDTDGPTNLAALDGSATTGCHGWVESHPAQALYEGWRVPQGTDPAEVPVLLLGERRVLLTSNYGYEEIP